MSIGTDVDGAETLPGKRKKKPAKKSAIKRGRPPAPPWTKRSERIDMRVTIAEKKRVAAKAKKLGRSVTSLLYEAIENIK